MSIVIQLFENKKTKQTRMKKENRKENYKKSTYYKNREEQNHNTTTQCKPHIYANKATVIKGLKSLLVFL